MDPQKISSHPIARKKVANALLAVVSVLITIFILEAILHLTDYKALLFTSSFPRGYFVKDEVIGYDIGVSNKKTKHTILDLSYDVWSNNIGCFDKDYNDETPYIYLAGDSFSWGYSPFENSWGSKIEALTGMRVVQCGVPGFGTKGELIKTSRHLDKLPAPELIIVGYTRDNDYIGDFNFPDTTVREGFLVNNMTRDGLTAEEKEKIYSLYEKYCTAEELSSPIVQYLKCRLRNRSVIYNLLKDEIRDLAYSILPREFLKKTSLVVEKKPVDTPAISDVDFADHLQNIAGFKKLADEKGAELLLVLVPSKANENVKSFLEKENIRYLDLLPAFEKYGKVKSLRWKYDHHWNLPGNLLAGGLASKYILENDLTEASNREELLKEIDDQLKKEFGEI